MNLHPKTVGVFGGGTAGYLTALSLRRHLPELAVTLIDTTTIPIIGVGEATTPLMVPFLHDYLGLDIASFYAQVKPTWKLGVRLFWGAPGDDCFNFAFDSHHLAEAYVYDGHINRCSLGAQLMNDRRGPVQLRSDWSYASLLDRLPFAYHLDNQRFVQYLEAQALTARVERVNALVADVALAQDGSVAALLTKDGRRLSFDLYVDCSGFQSRLLGRALATPYQSYGSSLFTDRAVVGNVPRRTCHAPYTFAESMDHGWCWSIPELSEDHRGYVYSSQFASSDEARAELQRKNPEIGPTRDQLSFRPGRYERFWQKNVVGIGNAYAFVDPLESPALHMVLREASALVSCLKAGPVEPAVQARLSHEVGACWDYICSHIALHYKFNRKLDTPFWRACRADADLRKLAPMVAERIASGPRVGKQSRSNDPSYVLDLVSDETDLLLLGQQVIAPERVVPAHSRDEWARHLAQVSAQHEVALSADDALAACNADPKLCDPSGAVWYQTLASSLHRPQGPQPIA